MKNRVAVTGLGAISPLGLGIRENWEKIIEAKSAVCSASFEGCDLFSHSICGTVPEFDPGDYIPNRRLLKIMNRESMLASAAAGLAIKDAQLNDFYKSGSIGLYLGSGLTSGELDYLLPLIENSIDSEGNFSFDLLGKKALPNCNPLLSFKILPNMALSYISILYNIKGRNMAFNPWPGNTAQAIGEAMRAIEKGSIDCAVAGGCDSKNHFIGFTTFSNFGLLSSKGTASPFGKDSDGLILSEGASLVVLENYELAERRGARIYAELSGYSTMTDSGGQGYISSCPDILKDVMINTISDAGINSEDIDAVVAGADSISESDRAEAMAIQDLFKSSQPLVTSAKSLTGDMLAASPAFDICISAYSLSNGGMPALINNSVTGYDLNFSSAGDPLRGMESILINSFAPGTAKTSLLLRRS